MKKLLEKIKKDHRVAHVLRAAARYGKRLGPASAAAITYFSILAIPPVLMVAFSMLGMTVTTLRPELMDEVSRRIQEQAGSSGLGEGLTTAVKNALEHWGTIFSVGLLAALYAGAGWVSNLKTAMRALWRPELESPERKRMIVLEVLVNISILLGIIVLGALTAAASSVGTALNGVVISALGLQDVPGIHFLTWLGSFLISVAMGTLMFLYIYRVLPQPLYRVTKRQWLLGSLFAGIGLSIIQNFGGVLFRLMSRNAAAAAFGNVIVLMLLFNYFAQLTLFIASWIATTNQPAVAREYNEADEPLRNDPATEAVDDHWAEAAEHKRRQDREAELKKQGLKPEDVAGEDRPESARHAYARARQREGLGPVPPQQAATMVPQDVAAKGVRAGMGAGYVVGAATGVGLGALAGRLVHAFVNRRR